MTFGENKEFEPDRAGIRLDPKEKWQVEQEMVGIRLDAA